MDYEQLKQTIKVEMSFLDILAITANLHLSLRHPENQSWSSIHSKGLGRRMLNLLISEKIGLPKQIITYYEEVFGKK